MFGSTTTKRVKTENGDAAPGGTSKGVLGKRELTPGKTPEKELHDLEMASLKTQIDSLSSQIVSLKAANSDAIRSENNRLKAEIEKLKAAPPHRPEAEEILVDTGREPDAVARIDEAENFAAQQEDQARQLGEEVQKLQLLLATEKERGEADMRTIAEKNGVIANLEKRIETLTEQVRRMKGEAASLRAGLIEEADIAEEDPTYRDACRLYDDPGMTLQQWRNHVARAKSLKRQKKWAILLEQLTAYGDYLGYKDTGF